MLSINNLHLCGGLFIFCPARHDIVPTKDELPEKVKASFSSSSSLEEKITNHEGLGQHNITSHLIFVLWSGDDVVNNILELINPCGRVINLDIKKFYWGLNCTTSLDNSFE